MEEIRSDVKGFREPQKDVDPLFVNRWSPRALERDMDEEDLEALFEAARWAPSSYNNQSWRFIYVTHEDEEWEDFCSFLSDFNREWAEKGFALVVVVSKTTFNHNGEFSRTHSFDVGAAWENLALEAARKDLVAHAMQGFDYEETAEELGVPEGFEVEAMVAVGSKGDESELDEDFRVQPNNRKDLDEIVFRGSFQ